VDSVKGREALQRDLDRLESWPITNCMTFNKSKCWIPHLGQGNPGYMYKLGDKRLESGPTERERFGLVASCIRINSVPWQPKGPTLFWCASSTAQLAGQGR